MKYTSLAALRTLALFREHLDALDLDLPCDEVILSGDESPLAASLSLECGTAGNRWCIQPMEGCDAAGDGKPSEHTVRRWTRYGESGAKLIWGGEAVAVSRHGRAHPRQMELTDTSLSAIEALRERLLAAHEARFGESDDVVIGLQLAHAGRWARPEDPDRPAPRAAYRHPLLDPRAGVGDDDAVLTDAEIEEVIERFVGAAVEAERLGFAFVDLMHCHGTLLHELLGAVTRPGPYGGDWENRIRAVRAIVDGIRRDAPDVAIGVRLSAFDLVPHQPGSSDGTGEPVAHEHLLPYVYGFSLNPDNPTVANLSEAHRFLDVMADLGVELTNVSAGAPQYSVHVQRPAYYPAPGEYDPPEDPLVGVVRLLQAARDIKYHHPDAIVVGSGFSYLQEYLPQVAQAVVRDEWMDFAGLGRIALSYHDLPADVLERGRLDRTRICRTYSACSAAAHEGRISGCYPQDAYYADRPDTTHLSERR